MTVKELKEYLQNVPEDLEVRIEYPNGNGSSDDCKVCSVDYDESDLFISYFNYDNI